MAIDLRQATSEDFTPLVGQNFEVRTSLGAVRLTLDNVKLFPHLKPRDSRLEIDGVVIPPRQCFALTFEGPREPVLEGMSYELSHPELGTLVLFVSPFRQDQDCMLYESVFN